MTEEQKARKRARNKEYYEKNKEKVYAKRKEWVKARPDKERQYALKRKYGITPEQWDEMFLSQQCRCKICRTDIPGGKQWHTDHCHTTGQVRGILCHGCNVGLGGFKDNKAALARAIDYLGT